MKTITLALCTTLMFCALAVAQQPTPAPPSKAVQSISENYVLSCMMTDLSFTMTGQEQKITRLSLVVASADFVASFPDAQANGTNFWGTLTPEDENTISIKYTLNGMVAVPVLPGNAQNRSISTQGTVRLRLGKPINILETDTRHCVLTTPRLSDHDAKDK